MQRSFKSLGELGRHFRAVAAKMEATDKRILKGVGVTVSAFVSVELGTYQDAHGPFQAWAELAESTKERRVKQGYTPNDPLYASGELEQSVSYRITGMKVAIGSPLDHALYLEEGTSRMPPRAFLGPAMIMARKTNSEAMLHAIVATFRGSR